MDDVLFGRRVLLDTFLVLSEDMQRLLMSFKNVKEAIKNSADSRAKNLVKPKKALNAVRMHEADLGNDHGEIAAEKMDIKNSDDRCKKQFAKKC